jgi:predicted glutamate--cysteine ligase
VPCTDSELDQPLLKGVEEEVFAGTPDGQVVGLSDRVAAALPHFTTEPDARNVEFATAPHASGQAVVHEVMARRSQLRQLLHDFGNYTLIPGATIPLETDDAFRIADEANPYYRFIRNKYGIRVVTASTQINIGIGDTEQLMRVYRVLRCEAAAYLALTAASPFYQGKATGYHSTRWKIFPKTPAMVPLFADHPSFVDWIENQLASGAMFNPRHLWLSVRPNGPQTPRRLSRLELRICDRVDDPKLLLALLALFETRVQHILRDTDLDPLRLSGVDEQKLLGLVDANEREAARRSLDATAVDWRTGAKMPMRSWIDRMLSESSHQEPLRPIARLLQDGNRAENWMRRFERGESIERIITATIAEEAERDQHYVA